jgi:hypothetical protein
LVLLLVAFVAARALLIGQALLAEGLEASRTRAEAIRAEPFLACLACCDTIRATSPAAIPAGIRTLAADLCVAVLAAGVVVLTDQLAAVSAWDAVPALQTDVGAGRVVGPEDLAYEDEEVEESAFLHGAMNGRAAVSLAELVVLDVRMGRVRAGRRRVGVQGDHLVASPDPARVVVHIQGDLESAQIDSFEDDRLGDDRQPVLSVQTDIVELVVQGQQLVEQLSLRGKLLAGTVPFQFPRELLQTAPAGADRPAKLRAKPAGSPMPASAGGLVDLPD